MEGAGREGGELEVSGGGEQVHLCAKFICVMLNVGGLVMEQTLLIDKCI